MPDAASRNVEVFPQIQQGRQAQIARNNSKHLAGGGIASDPGRSNSKIFRLPYAASASMTEGLEIHLRG
jgi:hypothetical protein